MEHKQALEGIKVLDFGKAIVVPTAAVMLAAYGATVVKVETAQSIDSLRSTPPFKDAKSGVNRSPYFAKYNFNKFGLGLNLSKPKGRELFYKLVAWCDVLLEGNAPGVAGKFGIAYEEMKKLNPGLIMLHTSQLGQEGPQARFKGYGAQASALAGFYDFVAYPDRPAVGPYGAFTDLVTYQSIVAAVMSALLHRKRTGKGVYMDHSQVEAATLLLAPAILQWSANEEAFPRMGNRNPGACPHGFYRCLGEDRWCAIAVFNDEEWQGFCRALGNPEWTREQKFATLLARKQNEDELDKLVESWTRNQTVEHVMQELQANGVAAGIVATGADLYNDHQLKSRGYYVEMEHPEIGCHYYERPPHIFSKTPARLRSPGICLGQHNEYVCREILGLSDTEISDLIADGVLES